MVNIDLDHKFNMCNLLDRLEGVIILERDQGRQTPQSSLQGQNCTELTSRALKELVIVLYFF